MKVFKESSRRAVEKPMANPEKFVDISLPLLSVSLPKYFHCDQWTCATLVMS